VSDARRAVLVILWLLTAAAPSFAAAAGPGAEAELERLNAAAALHPEDFDLAWARAGALRRAGREEEAIAAFRALAVRRPGARARSQLEVGILLHQQGDAAAALDALDDALALDPRLHAARLHRALALQALGRHAEAARELAFLARVSPELEEEARLLGAVVELSRGERDSGREALRQLADVAPESQASGRARELLERLDRPVRPASSSPRGSLWLRAGGEFDSNVTLDSGASLAGVSTDSSDERLTWGAGFVGRALAREWGSLDLGYGYGETAHEDLAQFDLQTHQVFAALGLAGPRSTHLRLDALASDAHLASDRYLRSWTVRPNLLVPLGARLGVGRIYAEAERRSYHEQPVFSSLVRDGTAYALGVEQYAPLPWPEGAQASLGLAVGRTNTEASRDLFGFAGDYDDRNGRLSASVLVPLGDRFDLRLGAGATRYRYLHRNLIDGISSADPHRRRDTALQGNATLGWNFARGLRVELRWQGIDNRSNVEAYDYERNITGLHFVAQRSIP
jgi:tetratricopeptide (TPR) repeat protein